MHLHPELVVLDVGVLVHEVVAACLIETLAVVATFAVARMSVLIHRVLIVCCAMLKVVVPGAATWLGVATLHATELVVAKILPTIECV